MLSGCDEMLLASCTRYWFEIPCLKGMRLINVLLKLFFLKQSSPRGYAQLHWQCCSFIRLKKGKLMPLNQQNNLKWWRPIK